MRILICAGGSGGGIYPALSVWQVLVEWAQAVLWVGGEGGLETTLVPREGIRFKAIPAAGVHGVGLRTLPGNVWKLIQGYLAARKIIREFKPDALLFTGGYVAVPVALAGLHVPALLYVPDIEPGLALKTLARFADHIALIAPDTRAYLSPRAKTTVTGHPVRKDLANWSKPEARHLFSLEPDEFTLLVFGGSKGARSINRAILAIVEKLLPEMQIIHVTGSLDWEEVRQAREALPVELTSRYHIYEYLHEEMGAAYSAADLVVSRSGASAIGEFPRFGLPAIVVPYPHAWRYQKVNADYLVKNGAAVMVKDEDLGTSLYQAILDLSQDVSRRAAMGNAMAALAHPEAAREIAELLRQLASGEKLDQGIKAWSH